MPEHNTHHPQAVACHPNGCSIWVDSGMVALLEACWGHGLETMHSCQQSLSDSKAYVMFAEPSEAEVFLNLAGGEVDNERGSLFSRVRCTQHFEKNLPDWTWEIWATLHDDNNQHYMEGPAQNLLGLRVRTVVRFPNKDIAQVAANLAAAFQLSSN